MTKRLLFYVLFFITTYVFSQKNHTLKGLGAHPNPFNIETKISFKSDKIQTVVVTVVDILGKSIMKEKITADRGINSIAFRRNDNSAGMYIYSVQTTEEIVSKRFVIR